MAMTILVRHAPCFSNHTPNCPNINNRQIPQQLTESNENTHTIFNLLHILSVLLFPVFTDATVPSSSSRQVQCRPARPVQSGPVPPVLSTPVPSRSSRRFLTSPARPAQSDAVPSPVEFGPFPLVSSNGSADSIESFNQSINQSINQSMNQ